MNALYRVKPYAHNEYKFVVRAKLDGSWKRRYFRTEDEAVAYAEEQNMAASASATDSPVPTGYAGVDPASPVPLPWTGERLITSCQRPLAYEHLHRYAIACSLAAGKRVLDIACGEGYGANLLAGFAEHVIGIDVAANAIAHAQQRYGRPNLQFVEGDCGAIPLANDSVDLVASFETIEHLQDQTAFMKEIRRVLAPDGLLIISSPDKAAYANASAAPNPFHLAELTHTEFAELLKKSFNNTVTAKQRLVVGSWAATDEPAINVGASTFDGSFDHIAIEPGVSRGLYSIAVCSDAELPTINFGVFEQFQESAQVWDLLDRFDSSAEVAMRLTSLEEESEAKSQQLSAAQAEGARANRRVLEAQAEVARAAEQLATFREESSTEGAAFQRLNAAKSHRIAALRQKQQSQIVQLRTLQQRTEEMSAEVARLHRTVENRDSEATALRSRLQAETSAHATTKELRAAAAQEAAALQQRMEATSAEVVRLHRTVERRDSEALALRSQLYTETSAHATTEKLRTSAAQEAAALHQQLEQGAAQRARDAAELIDAQWELLTLRGDAMRRSEASAEVASKLLEMENVANAATSERDQLRGMVIALQKDLAQEQLNVRAMQSRLGFTEEYAASRETAVAEALAQKQVIEDQLRDAEQRAAATSADLIVSTAHTRMLEQQFQATEDSLMVTERRVLAAEGRAAASEAQLATVQAQLEATQQQLRSSGKELAARRKQILRLRERLTHRLILPFGKSQQHLYELTK